MPENGHISIRCPYLSTECFKINKNHIFRLHLVGALESYIICLVSQRSEIFHCFGNDIIDSKLWLICRIILRFSKRASKNTQMLQI